MCLVDHAFGGEIFLINNIGPITRILANWIECCSWRLMICPRIIPTSLSPFIPRYLMKNWNGWTLRYLWWRCGPFCHDTLVSDEEVENHRNNRHYLIPPCSFCPKIFKEKAEVIEPVEVLRYKHIGISNVSFLSKTFISFENFF